MCVNKSRRTLPALCSSVTLSQLMRVRVRVMSQSNKSAGYGNEVYTVWGACVCEQGSGHGSPVGAVEAWEPGSSGAELALLTSEGEGREAREGRGGTSGRDAHPDPTLRGAFTVRFFTEAVHLGV